MRFVAGFAVCLALLPLVSHAQWWDSTTPGGVGTKPAPSAYTREDMARLRMTTAMALAGGEFAKLERMHDEFLRDRLRATDGQWLLEAFQAGIEGQFRGPEADTERYLRDWAAAIPGSTLLPAVKAMRWHRLAWNARGGGFASAVPEEAFQIFRERLDKAAAALGESPNAGKASPLWYSAALSVAASRGASSAAVDALFDEAVARFPTYHRLHYTRVNFLMPEWGGSLETVDAFVEKSVKLTAATEGEAFYAWVYIGVAQGVRGNFLESTRATWPKMKKAFADMVARYPDPYNRNLFATFACRVRDRETTARLLAELGAAAKLGAYSPGITTEGCQRFALEKA